MRRLLVLILLTVQTFTSFAQLSTDSSLYSPALNHALSRYIEAVGINAAIYSGSENVDPRFPINDGNAFYGLGLPVSGNILYDNILYADIPLWLDLVNGNVVVKHPGSEARINLKNQKISYFSMGTEQFVAGGPLSKDFAYLPEGFYKVLHLGISQLFGTYSKKMSEVIRESQYMTNYTRQQSQYFLNVRGKLHPVKDEASIIRLLSDKRSELQAYLKEIREHMKTNNIRGQQSVELGMTRLLAYYDQISL